MKVFRRLSFLFIFIVLCQTLYFSQRLKIGLYFMIGYPKNGIEEIIDKNSVGDNKIEKFAEELFRYLRIIGKNNSIDFVRDINDTYTNFTINISYDHSEDSIVIGCYQDKEPIFKDSGKIRSNTAMEKLIYELSTKILERISIIRLRFGDFDDMLQLTFDRSIDEYPCFSNDGSLLLFVSDRDTGNRDIYILDLNKMYIRRDNLPESSEYFPRISSDNSKLVFQSTRGGKWTIWIQEMNELDGTSTLEHIPTSGNAYTPSCDEKGVYFVQETKDNNTDIFFYDFSSKRIFKIFESDEEEFSPSPSKLGIVFIRVKEDGDSGVYLLTKSNEIKILEDSPFNEFDPILTSDNKWVIFSSNRDGVYRLWLKNLDSGVVYRLTDQKDGDAFYPTIHENTVVFSMYSKAEPDLWAVSIMKYVDIEKKRYELIDKIEKTINLLRN